MRAAAAVRLARCGGAQAVPGLCELLQDEQWELRVSAAQAIGAIADSNAVGPLVTALLAEKQWDVRYEIVDALRNIGDPKAVNELLVLLDGGNADVGLQQVTTWALKEFGWEHLTPAQQAVVLTLRDEWNEIPKLGSAAIIPVVDAIKNGTPRLQTEATDALARMREPQAVDALLDLLKDPSQNIRTAAATALERHAWTHLTETQSAQVAITLGKWSVAARCGSGAIDAMIAAARDGTMDDRLRAIEALGQVGGPRAAGLLGKALCDKEPETRCVAARALARCSGAKPTPELIAALDDEAATVRSEAAKSLTAMKWSPATVSERVTLAAAMGLWGEVSSLGVEAIDPILACMQRPSTRAAAFEALVGLGELATEPLTKLLSDPNASLRIAAADAIGETGASSAIESLTRMAGADDELAVRTAALDALRRLGWQPADDCEAARFEIALEHWPDVVKLGPAAIAPLLVALDDNRFSRNAGRSIEEILHGSRASEIPVGLLHSLAALGDASQRNARAATSTHDPSFHATITRRRLAQLARAELQRRKQLA